MSVLLRQLSREPEIKRVCGLVKVRKGGKLGASSLKV